MRKERRRRRRRRKHKGSWQSSKKLKKRRPRAKEKKVVAEEPQKTDISSKATAKGEGKREADFSNLFEDQMKRIRREKQFYGERARRRLRQLNKSLNFTWSKSTRKWMMKDQGDEKFRPFHKTSASPKMVA